VYFDSDRSLCKKKAFNVTFRNDIVT